MTQRLIIANWKMFGDPQAINYWSDNLAGTNHHVVLCVQPLLIQSAVKCAVIKNNYSVGGQDCHFKDEGPYTGFTSPKLLADVGASYVIIGHSERRHFEDDALIQSKAIAAIRNHMVPIICVGESLETRQKGQHEHFTLKQLSIILENLSGPYCIAYEPLWAIGTGVVPTTHDIESMHASIRRFIKNDSVKILYGGSVSADNAKAILALKNVDGLLVGGASLKVETFNQILLAM